ncbi:MAG: AzlC family ABC transporter permease [Pseudomonadota bacterium]
MTNGPRPAKTVHESPAGIRLGLARALPIVIGYAPVAFAYGVLAQKAGISDWNIILMSVLVFAGASQFIAVGLMEAAVPAASIILTTFVVNLRHMILASALAPHLRRWRVVELAAFSCQLTDETFALHASTLAAGPPDKKAMFTLNACAQAAWVLGSWLGVAAGRSIGNVKPFALDFALPALFTALLALQIRNRFQVLAAAAGGGLSLLFLGWGLNKWNIILAAVAGAAAGALAESWTKKRSS